MVAGQGKLFEAIASTMLAGDDVFDIVGKERLRRLRPVSPEQSARSGSGIKPLADSLFIPFPPLTLRSRSRQAVIRFCVREALRSSKRKTGFEGPCCLQARELIWPATGGPCGGEGE